MTACSKIYKYITSVHIRFRNSWSVETSTFVRTRLFFVWSELLHFYNIFL